jgi:Flp pilus assembly protein TadD
MKVEAIDQNKNDINTSNGKGIALRHLGRYEEADQSMKR